MNRNIGRLDESTLLMKHYDANVSMDTLEIIAETNWKTTIKIVFGIYLMFLIFLDLLLVLIGMILTIIEMISTPLGIIVILIGFFALLYTFISIFHVANKFSLL